MAEVISIKDILAPSFFRPYNDFITGRKSTICLAGGRGCVDGDTILETPKGNVKVRDFNGGEIYSFDGKRTVRSYACRAIRYTKESLYCVELDNGKSILATDEHRFLTSSGWKMVKELCCGDGVLLLHDESQQLLSRDTQDLATAFECSQQSQDRDASSSSPSRDLSNEPSSVLKASCDSPEKHCEEYQQESREDVLHLMRRLLGCLYHYWHDCRLCDGQLPKEEETYQDVFQRLTDVPAHSRDNLRVDGLAYEQIDSPCDQYGFLPSKQDCQLQKEGKCLTDAENEISHTLFESLFEIFPSASRFQTNEDLACSIRQVAVHLLYSIDNLDSSQFGSEKEDDDLLFSKDNVQEVNNLRMLSDMLRHRVHDESFSSSFVIDEDVLIHAPQLTKCAVKSISEVKKDFYYDLFVPFYNNYITDGGIINHNSCKSSAISVMILLGLERDRRAALVQKAKGDPHWRREMTHALCLRKVANTLADSVYAQFQWAAEKLHLTDKYVFRKTPLMIERVGTGQRIMFRGLDDPQRLKSLKFPFSYGRFLWSEELAEYSGIEEILDVQRSVQRGGHDFKTFMSYNPPETSANWVNQRIAEIAREDPTFGFYKSDYRSVPRAWLGDKFFHDADILRRINERAYRHQYLGEVTGNGGTVFPNVRPVTLSDADIAKFDRIRFGVDFGMVDPTVMMAIYYDRLHHAIYIFDEIYKSNMTVDEMEREFKQMHDVKYKSWEYIIADCAGSTLILSLRQKGLKMLPCKKGPDSIMAGVKWLQSLTGIYIDGRRCPNALREFQLYEYEKLRDNSFSDRLPDRENHAIDSVRYGCSSLITKASMFG